MPKLAKNKYNLVIDPKKSLFRWKVDGYPALLFSAYYGAKRLKYGWPKSEIFFANHDCFWWNNWADIINDGKNCLNKLVKKDKSDFLSAYYQDYNHVFKQLVIELKKLEDQDFKNIDRLGLRKIWFHFFKFYSLKFWYTGIVPEVVAYTASLLLTKEIERSSLNISPEELSKLTIFPEKSFLMEEESELLKIARLKSAAVRQKSLAEHAQKFRWILNGYHGVKKLTRNYFAKRLRELLKEGGANKQRAHYQNYSSAVKDDFQNIIRKHGLKPAIINLARLAQRGSYLQDNRKKYQLIATEYILKLYQTFAGHLKISLEQALYINWIEFDDFIAGRKGGQEIARRQKHFRFSVYRGHIRLLSDDYRNIFKTLEEEYTKNGGRELKGLVVYPGVVRGRVRIIRSGREIKNFRSGEILVALMTSPDYIVAIKKAKAIVTDDGGLTCHAAITARELKKPGIVGTKNATRVLKNGDLVEVDANQGIVRKIR